MFPLENGAFEMLVLGALALIIVGPKDLPVLMRKVGQFTAKMRGMAAEFRASFDELARQSELEELRKEVEALRTGHYAAPVSAEVDKAFYEHDQTPTAYPSPAPEPEHPAPIPLLTDGGADHGRHGEEVFNGETPPPPSSVPLPTRGEDKKPPAPKPRARNTAAAPAIAPAPPKPRKPRAKPAPAAEPEA